MKTPLLDNFLQNEKLLYKSKENFSNYFLMAHLKK